MWLTTETGVHVFVSQHFLDKEIWIRIILERNKVSFFCFIYYDFDIMVLYKCSIEYGRKNNKNMICACKYYITLSSVELFKVL
jgi:hypothetical protein